MRRSGDLGVRFAANPGRCQSSRDGQPYRETLALARVLAPHSSLVRGSARLHNTRTHMKRFGSSLAALLLLSATLLSTAGCHRHFDPPPTYPHEDRDFKTVNP